MNEETADFYFYSKVSNGIKIFFGGHANGNSNAGTKKLLQKKFIKSCIRTTLISLLFTLVICRSHASDSTRWVLQPDGIQWNVNNDKQLPHKDNIEMSGQLISAIITYGVDAQRNRLYQEKSIGRC
ncbi:MAG: hypothetical protein ACR2KZ_13645 [Segetibacter sp.]